MLDKLYTQVFDQGVQAIGQGQKDTDLPHLVTGLDSSARAIFIAKLYHEHPTQMVVVESNSTQYAQFVEDLNNLLPEVTILTFPAEESLALEYATQSPEGVAQRVETLQALINREPVIVVTGVAGLRRRLTPVDDWIACQVRLEVGSEIERDQLEAYLFQLGYQRESIVKSPGEFSIRGSIVDFYPLNSNHPIRLDFFDTELDSIRYFEAETQSSIENLQSVLLEPAKDLLFNQSQQQSIQDKLRQELKQTLKKVTDPDLSQNLKEQMTQQIEGLDQGQSLKYASAFLAYYDPAGTSLLDYLNEAATLIVNEFDKVHQLEIDMIESNQFWLEQETAKGYLFPKQSIKLSAFDLIKSYKGKLVYFALIQKGLAKTPLGGIHSYQYRSMNPFFNQMPLVKTEMDHWLRQGQKIQVLVESKKRADKVMALFNEHRIQPSHLQEGKPYEGAINLIVGSLSQGFELPLHQWVVITEKELFNRMKKRTIKQQKLTNAERIKSYNDLEEGDYVVHVNHGIGRYTGLETMEIGGVHRDLLTIEYQNNARVMVPVDQIHLLQKYVSSGEAKTPRIHKLGGTEWTKTKQRVSSRIEDIADELIELYAQRDQEKGHAFEKDTPEQLEFEGAFPYVETPDQLQSTKEIKKDMEQERPMDRLLIGDVGYGKTEVAMRAIFKAVIEGKQAAFLVPTTILAQQHYNSLVERFADYPFEIRMLSRFVSRADQQQTIKDLKVGACQIVVGTHRLLSQDVDFLDLGLLIVDEEQRFGVKHKERLKQLRSQVDVLTLTATPIPRTLHMSMIGVRDLSVIETPPSNRYPVQTYVMERNEGAIKSAIEREMARGGQCFYLYNRVATIYQRAQAISDLVPEARVAVAHGQMSEVELENVLYAFIQGEYDVLVTTTIIETGVDIPNANTLFIEHADRMGLSTLYQLRGRVGRTNRIAFAYLMFDPMKQLSEVSEKRLNAIREFTELGSGFKIAMRDLSIRGAGNLLGAQQSGFIDSVGFDLYSQMLKEAVERRRNKEATNQGSRKVETEIDLAIDAYLPSSYIQDERQKIAAYKAIQKINDLDSLRDMQDQLIDRYGEYPDAVADLLEIALLQALASQLGILQIKRRHQSVVLTFEGAVSEILYGPRVFEALQGIQAKAKVHQQKQALIVELLVQGLHSDQVIQLLLKFTQQSQAVINHYQQTEASLQQTFTNQEEEMNHEIR